MNIMQPVKTGLKFYKCKNITVEGIIIRDCAGLSLIQSGCEEIHYNNVKLIGMWSIDNIPGRISDVTFNNIKITSDYDLMLNLSFNGIDNEHNASNITLKNITLNGRKLTKNDFNISTDQFTDYKIY